MSLINTAAILGGIALAIAAGGSGKYALSEKAPITSVVVTEVSEFDTVRQRQAQEMSDLDRELYFGPTLLYKPKPLPPLQLRPATR